MKSVSNKTHKPLSIPLPGGKKLHLGPGKTGQVASDAVDYAPLKKMIDAGELAVVGEGSGAGEGAAGGKQRPGATGPAHTPGTVSRRSGDR